MPISLFKIGNTLIPSPSALGNASSKTFSEREGQTLEIIGKIKTILEFIKNGYASKLRETAPLLQVEYQEGNIKKITVTTFGKVGSSRSNIVTVERALTDALTAILDRSAQSSILKDCPGFSIRDASIEVEYSNASGEISRVTFEMGTIHGIEKENNASLIRFFQRAAHELHYGLLLPFSKKIPGDVLSIRIPFTTITLRN